MNDKESLLEQFEANRPHLQQVAARMLGSQTDASDALQTAWLKVADVDTSDVTNMRGWLTTVVSRVCLDMLRSRKSREADDVDNITHLSAATATPEDEALLADSLGSALLLVLDTLSPAERLAFVLHDMFAVSFDEIAVILNRTPASARQLASRARRRVQGGSVDEQDASRQREIVDAFLNASRNGDFAALMNVLHPDVVVRADATAVRLGAEPLVSGADAVAENFFDSAAAAEPVSVNGDAGLAWQLGPHHRVVFDITVVDGKIVEINLIGDQADLESMTIEPSS